MRIDTRYNLDDVVWPIYFHRNKLLITCSGCVGAGCLWREDKTKVECPRCRGEKTRVKYGDNLTWLCGTYERPASATTVVRIKVEQHVKDSYEQSCCCAVNSGAQRYWYEAKNLFLTGELAEAECEKRNAKETKP